MKIGDTFIKNNSKYIYLGRAQRSRNVLNDIAWRDDYCICRLVDRDVNRTRNNVYEGLFIYEEYSINHLPKITPIPFEL
jgi:hypothetical protein